MSVASPAIARNWKLLASSEGERPRPGIVGIANQKGGVGKTTTAVNLAAALALKGRRVLVVDVDPQSNATTGLGLDHRAAPASAYDLVLDGADLDDVVLQTRIDGLDCIPGSLDLAGAEVELVGREHREHQLGRALEGAADRYDLVLLDCPPSLGLLTINALTAARDLIVPVQCEYYALEGLGQLLSTAERIRLGLNPELRISGFLLTMYDARTKLSPQVAEEIRGHFGDLVFKTVIPRSVRLSEAPSFGEPVLTLDPSSRGSISYRLLATEVEERYGMAPTSEARVDLSEAPASRLDARRGWGDPRGVLAEQRAANPGPGGRGYGTVAPEPEGLDTAFPPEVPWTVAP